MAAIYLFSGITLASAMRVVVEMAAIYLFSGIALASLGVAVEMAAIYLLVLSLLRQL